MIAATTSRLPRCFCAIALGMTIWATQALAQPQIMIRSSEGGSFQTVAPGRFSNLLRPDYTRRDLKIMLSELQITRDQRYVLEVLLDDYTERFNKAAEQFKAVRDRYQGPAGRFGAFGSEGAQQMAEIALQSLQENLANVHTFELEGGGGTFVGILRSEVSGGGGEGGRRSALHLPERRRRRCRCREALVRLQVEGRGGGAGQLHCPRHLPA